MYNYGLIGNCQIASLISDQASIDWLCLPRMDSPPVFGKILDPEGGEFSIRPAGNCTAEQRYLPNTAVIETIFTDGDGNQCRVLDFCPRFYLHDRIHRPVSLFRIVEPLKGVMSLRAICRPVDGWSKKPARPTRGNSHLRYDIGGESLRLTTNMPLTYLEEEQSFLLREKTFFALTWGLSIDEDLAEVANRFFLKTVEYWSSWVLHCSIPVLYQTETIRSAITLKLHCYEDTGAILAAMTTSLPEELGGTRNWDYRMCWMRDTYFILSAFHQLGHFEEMEKFLKYLGEIGETHEHAREKLHPVYRLDRTLPVPETEHPNWAGYRGSRPVRTDNQAAEQVQNDSYGEMILTLAPIFFDERFRHLRTPEHERLLCHLTKLCANSIGKPDAGLWELRGSGQEHSFTNLMCWAGLDRAERIRAKGYLRALELDPVLEKGRAEKALRAAIRDGSLRNGPSDDTFDSALLQIGTLGFPDEELTRATVERIAAELRLGADDGASSFLYRYLREDDFGKPSSSFLICSFWLVNALARLGDKEKAAGVMNHAMRAANGLGLFAEHFDPTGGIQSGNFPQCYSHVGQINAAFALSPAWNTVL